MLAAQTEYFPLSIGNRWTYDYHEELFHGVGPLDTVFTISIIDTLQSFYLFDRYFLYGDYHFLGYNCSDSSLFGVQDEKVIRHLNGREMIWYDFSVDRDSSWVIPVRHRIVSGDTANLVVTLLSKTDTFVANQDTLKNCYRFFFEFTKMFPEMGPWKELFAPGIGLVEIEFRGYMIQILRFRNGIISGQTVDVDRKEACKGEVPKDFFLLVNYPNPFQKTTKIRYQIRPDIPTFVTLTIYDIAGREIRSLTDICGISGKGEVVWDGKDDAGLEVASGIYFYSLFINDHLQRIRKLVLVK